MVCPVCKAENGQNAKFCQECGLRLELQCPYCGAGSSAGAKFCCECGSALDFRCSQCGGSSRPGAKFCQQCGSRLVTICFQCQAPTPPGARFCQQCGSRLERRCSACGVPILHAANFCNGCGAPLVSGVVVPAATAVPVYIPPPAVVAPPPQAQPAATTPPAAPAASPPDLPVASAPPPPPAQQLPVAEAPPPPATEVPPAPALEAPEVPAEAPVGPAVSLEDLLAEALAQSPAQPQDERRLVTILFGDVSGFTAMSEKLDPEDVKAIMDRCLKQLADQVVKYEGTVDKFAGDNIMAIWGAPVSHEDDAERAVMAALDMQEALRQFAEDLKRRRGFDLKMRIGINTGEVVSGTVAAGREKDYTVMGDVVNTASRFEHAATPGRVMVGEKTYALTKHAVDYEELDPIMVKGKTEPLKVYQAAGVRTDRGRRRGLGSVDSPMVGRGGERDVLFQDFHEVVESRAPHLSVVVGIPGIGKSRLLEEFQQSLNSEDIEFAWCKGRCLPYGQGIAFYPLAEMLKGLFSIMDSDPREEVLEKLLNGVTGMLRRARAGAAPEEELQEEARQLAHRLGYAMGLSFPDNDLLEMNPANVKEELFWAWRRFFSSWASLSPLVVILEDAHWADALVLELLRSIVVSLDGVPILFLCLTRPELLDQAPELIEGPQSRVLRLQPLTVEEGFLLVDQLLSPNLLSHAWKERVVQAAGGVPFYLEEIIRTLLEEEQLVKGPAGWGPAESEKLPDLPDTVYATLSARLDRLPGVEKTHLQRAAVVGSTFWESALSHPAAPSVPEQVILQDLGARGWVVGSDTSSFAGDREYSFANTLVRETAYKGLTRRRRSDEHLRVGRWLEAKVPDRLDEFVSLLAYHYGQATLQDIGAEDGVEEGALVKAVGYEWRAADRARLQQSYTDALTRYDDTCSLIDRLGFRYPDESLVILERPLWRLRIEALLDRARVKEPLGQHDSALADLDSVLSLAADRTASDLRGGSLVQKARVLRLKGQPEEAITCAEEAIQIFDALGDRAGATQALTILGELHSDEARMDEFETVCRRAVALAGESGLRWLEAKSINLLGSACIYQGKMEEAAEHLGQASEYYEELNDRRGLAQALLLRGRVLHAAGQSSESIQTIERAFAIFDELGDLPMRAAALATLAQLHFERGNTELAHRSAERGLALARAIGQAGQLLRCLLLLSQVQIEQGHHSAAVDLLREAQEVCDTSDQPAILPEVYRLLAQAYLGCGDLKQAEEYALRGRNVVEESDHYSQGTTWLSLAMVHAAAGRPEEAEQAFADALAAFELSGETYDIGEGHLEFSRFLLSRGRSVEAREHLEKAQESFGAMETRDKLDQVAVLQAGF